MKWSTKQVLFYRIFIPKKFHWKDGIFIMKQGQFKSVQQTQIAKFMGPTWGPPGSCRPQMGPMLAPWTLLSGEACYQLQISQCFLSQSSQVRHSALHHWRAISVRVYQLCDYLPHREQWQLWKYGGANGLVMAMCRAEWEEGKPVKTIVIYFTELKIA